MKSMPRTAGPASGSRVFVLDDEETVLAVIGRILRRAGFEVITFSSPRAFLSEARLDPPCCLVLDFHMPELNGAEIQELLAAAEQPPSIVFVSGAADVGTSVKAMKAGAVDFLAKPFEPEELVSAVRVALRSAEARFATHTATAGARALLDRLTPREREVCELVVRGMRSKEIAEELGSAVKTVNIHRSRIMSKLGATTVVELVHLLERAGAKPT